MMLPEALCTVMVVDGPSTASSSCAGRGDPRGRFAERDGVSAGIDPAGVPGLDHAAASDLEIGQAGAFDPGRK